MQATNRKLLALALCAAFAAPAFAGDNPPTKATKSATTSTVTKPMASTASDAVSARATTRESARMTEPKVKAAASATTNPGKGNWWADADIDGDGQLSAAEAKANAGLDARFTNIDADADGYVTNEEYRQFFASEQSQGEAHAAAHSAVVTRDVFKLDANADGKLSPTELTANAALSGAFSVMDSNKDGFVTQAEYDAYAKVHLKK
jgi:Ca2+-binding EF-hand superfamily protein